VSILTLVIIITRIECVLILLTTSSWRRRKLL